MFSGKDRSWGASDAVLLHMFLCSIGFVRLLHYFLSELAAPVVFSEYPAVFNRWAQAFYFPEKRYEILAYVVTAIGLFIYYFAAYRLNVWVQRWSSGEIRFVLFTARRGRHDQPDLPYAIALLAINLLVAYLPGHVRFGLIIGSLVWLLGFFYPATGWFYAKRSALNKHAAGYKNIYIGMLIVAIIQLAAIFYPFVFGKLRMINEFLDVPEHTILNSEYVDNDEYINRNQLLWTVNGSLADEKCIFEILPRAQNQRTERSSGSRVYDESEKEFLAVNRQELIHKIQNRWVIHHHNFVLGPVNEYALGKPLSGIYMQYGEANTVAMKFLLERLGTISYQDYFRIWFSFYPIYFLLLLALLFVVLRDLRWIAVASLFIASSVGFIGYQFLFLGPGLSPIRHFFDLGIILFFFLYLKNDSRLMLTLAAVFAVLGIANNSQIGLFGLAAVVITAGIRNFTERESFRYVDWAVLSVAMVTGAVIFSLTKGGTDPVTKYYLGGLLGFPLPASLVLVLFTAVSIGYVFLLKKSDVSPDLRYLSLFLLVYSQLLLIYFIWGGTLNHALNFASIFAFTLVAFLKLISESTPTIKKYLPVVMLVTASFAVLLFISSMFTYHLSKYQYDKIFSTHKTYEWNLDRAQFVSTMDPKYFTDSISLIRKYSSSAKGIFIISQYDNFLPFLAERYSAMPYFDLAWFLLSKREIDAAVETIRGNRPDYLFVDTRIEEDARTRIVDPVVPVLGKYHSESVMRAMRMDELRQVYYKIKDDYELVEGAYLLTAYKRKGAR